MKLEHSLNTLCYCLDVISTFHLGTNTKEILDSKHMALFIVSDIHQSCVIEVPCNAIYRPEIIPFFTPNSEKFCIFVFEKYYFNMQICSKTENTEFVLTHPCWCCWYWWYKQNCILFCSVLLFIFFLKGNQLDTICILRLYFQIYLAISQQDSFTLHIVGGVLVEHKCIIQQTKKQNSNSSSININASYRLSQNANRTS